MKTIFIIPLSFFLFLLISVRGQAPPEEAHDQNKLSQLLKSQKRSSSGSTSLIVSDWNKIRNRTPLMDSGIDYTPLDLTTNLNYILTRTYQKAMTDSTGITQNKDVIDQVMYFNGLGRPMQQVDIKASPDFYDVITTIEYDSYGRQSREYLGYAASQQGGAFNPNALIETYSFYARPQYENTTNPYSKKIFEPSPLNRVLETGAPGEDWLADPNSDTDHTIKYDNATNIEEDVHLYRVSLAPDYRPSLVASGSYAAGALFVEITKDENWQPGDGNDHTTKVFKDKQGNVVLERRYNDGISHDTYYVHDVFGNLTYIIPPKVNTSDGVSSLELDQLSYQYIYDQRNRLIEKKLPGKGWEYLVYNHLDWLVLRQDANLKTNNQWLFTKYDVLGRTVYTGIITSSSSRAALQNLVNDTNTYDQYESRTSSPHTYAGTTVHYTNRAYPTTNITALHTIEYYDNYDFEKDGLTFPTTVLGQTVDSRTKTLATGSKTRVLGTSHWITTLRAYDQKGRLIYSAGKNPYLSTIEVVEQELDFPGKILQTKTTHTKGSNAPMVTLDGFEYDHMGRLLTHTQKINSQSEERIAANIYDQLGQLVQKKVGNTPSNPPLQTIDYTYNVRGWLRSINNPQSLGDNLFSMEIHYNDPAHGGQPLYNGNISQTQWKTANDHSLRWYSYGYDALDRITSATAYSSNYHLSHVDYDKNGNITTLSRRGAINAAASSFGVMDNLTYTYDPATNKLRSVNDAGAALYGFRDGSSLTTQYTYDSNGNLISDANKGITQIQYNHLNLPIKITFNNSNDQVINYTYDATGVKLRKQLPGKTTDYAGSYVYETSGGNMEVLFFHPEGYVWNDNGEFHYAYNYVDHLGNIRLSYTNGNGESNPSPQIIQEKNYYPFGLTHRGYNGSESGLGSDAAKRYGFGGKELQSESLSGSALDWYDVLARNYDPAIGRWMSVDPLAEETMQPYSAFNNNPMYYRDPTGMIAEPIYDEYGNFIGNTKEGFIGQVLIYSRNKDVDFSELSAEEAIAMDGVDSYDNQRGSLTGDAKSNIWTHIASQMEGQQIYDETFRMSDLEGGKIYYDGNASGSWVSSYVLGKGKGKIRGSDGYVYETTVENIQSSIGVHEYYSHIKKNQGDGYSSHRLAYKNVINHKALWNKTTDAYKGFNIRQLQRYTQDETGRLQVDPLYRNLYNEYKTKW